MKSTFFLVVIVAVLLLSAGSCRKQLDKFPETALSDQNFWNSTNDLKLACNYLYSQLPSIDSRAEDVMSVDAYAQTANTVSNGNQLPVATSEVWTNDYILIRAANNILEKSGTVKGEQSDIDRFLGEAKFFRAWAYFDLVKRYGAVPLILKTVLLSDSLLFTARTNREIVIDSIYADLEFAAAHLPSSADQSYEDYGRITSGAAKAFTSRVALFEGTRQKFFNYGNFETHLQKSLAASDEVIASGEYGLFEYGAVPDSSYFFLFQYAGEGKDNPENILVRLYGENEVNDISSNNFTRAVLDEGLLSPTGQIAQAYLFKDGLPWDKSPYYQEPTNTLSEFENRDPRKGMSIFNMNMWYVSGYYQPTFEFTQTGYRAAKSYISADWTINVSYIDNMIIRYAEVLLNNIEARYELNGSVTDAELDATVNLIRTRATMPSLSNSFVSANGLDMREEIRRERRIELAFEGLRYWDLLRWKTAETELPTQVTGVKYFPDEQGEITDPVLTPDGFVIVEPASGRHFDPDRDYLWPIPTKELGLNTKLEQNPKW